MNTRQKKKWDKIIKKRIELINVPFIMSVGKTSQSQKSSIAKTVVRLVYTKNYESFDYLRKYFIKHLWAIDVSSGKDFSVATTYRRENGKIIVVKSEIIE